MKVKLPSSSVKVSLRSPVCGFYQSDCNGRHRDTAWTPHMAGD